MLVGGAAEPDWEAASVERMNYGNSLSIAAFDLKEHVGSKVQVNTFVIEINRI